MEHRDDRRLDRRAHAYQDDLARFVETIYHAVEQRDFQQAAELIETNMAATWYGVEPLETAQLLGTVVEHLAAPPPLLSAAHRILTASTADLAHTQDLANSLDHHQPDQMFVLAMFRMNDFRMHGQLNEAMEQADTADAYLQQMMPRLNPRGGWILQASVQLGITAMLAGEFPRALSAFMRAQMYHPEPKFRFLQRDAIVKSALIHASFGNSTTVAGLLKRALRIPRTSSWMEDRLDAHLEFVHVLHASGDPAEVIDRLEAISLHDIGEMWPFYIIAVHRAFEAGGHHDELEHRLAMLDALPHPRQNGVGFTGSVIPLKRAMVALNFGRGAEALELLARADPTLPYTKLVAAATDLFVGRYHQALEQAHALRADTRAFRLMEIRRLSILSAAQFMTGDQAGCLDTLTWAAGLPHGLTEFEVGLFSHKIRGLAEEQVASWPATSRGASPHASAFTTLKHTLTTREIEVLAQLAQGHARAEIAKRLFVSLSTVKTQLKSVYRKLQVSSAAEAIVEGQRRGII